MDHTNIEQPPIDQTHVEQFDVKQTQPEMAEMVAQVPANANATISSCIGPTSRTYFELNGNAESVSTCDGIKPNEMLPQNCTTIVSVCPDERPHNPGLSCNGNETTQNPRYVIERVDKLPAGVATLDHNPKGSIVRPTNTMSKGRKSYIQELAEDPSMPEDLQDFCTAYKRHVKFSALRQFLKFVNIPGHINRRVCDIRFKDKLEDLRKDYRFYFCDDPADDDTLIL